MATNPTDGKTPEELEAGEKAKAEAEAAKVKAETPSPKKKENSESDWDTMLSNLSKADREKVESARKTSLLEPDTTGLLRTLAALKQEVAAIKQEKIDEADAAQKEQLLKEGKHTEVIAQQEAQLKELSLEVVAGQERIKTVESVLAEVAENRMKEVKMKPAMKELVERMPPDERVPFLNAHADEFKMKKIPTTPEEREAAGMSDKDRQERAHDVGAMF